MKKAIVAERTNERILRTEDGLMGDRCDHTMAPK